MDRGSGPQGDKYSSHLQADTIKPHHLHIKTIKEYIFFDVSSILPMTWLYRIYSLLGFVFSSFSTFNIGLDPSESVRWMNAGSLSLFQWIKLLIKLLPRDPGRDCYLLTASQQIFANLKSPHPSQAMQS